MPLTGQSRFKHFEPVHNTIVLVHYNNILEDIMKKLSKLLLCAVLISSIFTGCTGNFSSSQNNGRLKIVSTIFPSYDFACAIAGENADITILLSPGVESHSYEPTPQDMIQIQNCDLFLYTGGESDTWVDDLLSSLEQPINTVKMMDCVDVYEEEILEGMQAEDSSHAHEVEYDEHVWTSPQNAILISRAIEQALCRINPENTEVYQKNADSYVSELETLDQNFRDFFAGISHKTMIFGDRFPFRYFAEEYGLDCFAAFPGCSNETEPSAATIAFLTDKVKSEKISTVFYIEFSNHQVADSIAEATGAETAPFHSCHNVSAQEQKDGASYLSLMEQNLNTLKEVLR